MVRVPARRADQNRVILGLDDLFAKLVQLEPEVAPVALCDRIFAGREPVAHLRAAPDKHLTGHEADSRFFLILASSQLPSLVVLGFQDV